MSEQRSNPWKWVAIVLTLLLALLCVGGVSSGVTGLAFMARDTGVRPPGPTVIEPKPEEDQPRPDADPLVEVVKVGDPSRPDLEGVPAAAFDANACEDLKEGGPVSGPGCLSGTLTCGGDMIGHTKGGVDLYDTKFYEKKFCWPATVDHDSGDERIYKLTMPPGEWRARITLNTPCADLDVTAIRFDDDSCPTMRSMINQCEMVPRKNTQTEQIEVVSQTRNGHQAIWYVVVEGKDDSEGAFSLHIDCAEGLYGPYADDALPSRSPTR